MTKKLTKNTQTLADDALDFSYMISPAAMGRRLHGKRFLRYQHIDYLSAILRDRLLRGGARIVISMPPRHGKSWLTSLFTPIWFLSLFPTKRVILTSYEAGFASSWGRKVRNEIEANPFLGIEVSQDSSAADEWELKAPGPRQVGGGMVTAGIGGPITGRGGDLLIVDDPVKNIDQAMSQTYRQRAIDWYQSTFRTRGEPGASIIVIQTRWHEGDLAGWLLSPESGEKFEEIRLPALAEENDPLGRPLDAALCPERYTADDLGKLKKGVGSQMFNALYQQRPSALEGDFFKRAWWAWYKQPPSRFDLVIQSWDLSFKETKDGSFVVGQVWGRIGAHKYLLDQVRARADFPTTIKMIKNISAKWQAAHTKLIEDKANGPAVIASLKQSLGGIVAIEPDGTKEARAAAVSPQVEAGNVFLPEGAQWINDFVEECASFPKGVHDDQVDAMTQALKRLGGGTVPFAPIGVQSSYGH